MLDFSTIEEDAYGPMDLLPSELYTLAPREFFAMQEGARWRERQKAMRAAWICATIMNFAGKQLPEGKTVAPDELVKDRSQGRRMLGDGEQRRRLIERFNLAERFEIDALA